jgi:hypothetical protein
VVSLLKYTTGFKKPSSRENYAQSMHSKKLGKYVWTNLLVGFN